MRLISTQHMIMKNNLLVESKELTEWESNFMINITDKVKSDKGSTSNLSENQLDCIKKIYNKHF